MAKKPLTSQANTFQGDNFDLHLNLGQYDLDDEFDEDGDFSDFSDSDGDFESDVTLEELADGNIQELQNVTKVKVKATGAVNGDSMALVPTVTDENTNDPYNVDSDEEQDLLKGIKDEIREMVREEMHSELAVYQHKMKAIEAGRLPSANDEATKEEDKYPDLANLEPELRDAYIKMRKLDRILEKKMKKEKEVKRDRILLERRIREEIGNMQANGRVQRDIQANTDRYLSLALPPSHNEGVVVDETPVTPVFQTQVDEQDLKERQQKPTADTQESGHTSAASSRTDGTASTVGSAKSRKHSHKRNRKKDFIKRNKELAANAADMIAMTDDEKKRLQELLTDVDGLPDIPEDGVDVSVEENPYQIMVHAGEGFMPSENEMRTLTAIDQRLQSIMPEEDFRSIASSSLSFAPQQRLFTRVGARAEVDFEAYGEKALMETKEEREVTTKLKEIEDRLCLFQNKDTVQSETPALTEQQLENLLDDCVRSMSRVSMPTDTPDSVDSARTLESARAQLMVNPPRLSEETLQKLLSEAHFPLSAHLLALQDDDSKSANGDEGGVIRAETWKAIAEETLGDEEDEDSSIVSVTPRAQPEDMVGHRTAIRQSSVLPHPSISDPVVSRKPPQTRYTSYTTDFEGRESRVSLPEICDSPLINMPQGGSIELSQGASAGVPQGGSGNVPNNQNLHRNGRAGIRPNASLDNMVHNDLFRDSAQGHALSSGQRMAGTPLMIEELGGQGTPAPHPPSSERRSSSLLQRRSLGESSETDQKS